MTYESVAEKTSEIAESIAGSKAAREYWKAREKMESHRRAQQLFEELKLKTNSYMILAQQLPETHPKVMLAKLEMDEIEEQLRKIPVAIQYKEAQADVNEMTQMVISTLLVRLQDVLPVERGPRQGCGQGHGGQGCDCQS
ncbi:YlbF family regulator [Alicyclobacillus sp. SO9]|uniref:YlbF family regulator n=1 Tax=Alicyclobacillus sp. SO9 TaxID=2665646 RepID=UPI0018E757D2|nr:YlbF family regulator [Alicyclobacillus sp. SO9]QQE80966.1 YlbF family regulator [Alicyclobacillus sp. SO9]